MVTSEYILSIDEPEAGKVWIAGNYGVIFHSEDGGETWELQQSGAQVMLCDVDFVDSKNRMGVRDHRYHASHSRRW